MTSHYVSESHENMAAMGEGGGRFNNDSVIWITGRKCRKATIWEKEWLINCILQDKYLPKLIPAPLPLPLEKALNDYKEDLIGTYNNNMLNTNSTDPFTLPAENIIQKNDKQIT